MDNPTHGLGYFHLNATEFASCVQKITNNFLKNHYSHFVQLVTNAGFISSIYFLLDGLEEHILQADCIDAQFPALNGHR
ncbi:hypothetical protein I4U23_018635 [Adineta vaga]|nr:hypothetical protein I4U23_018635 [Adineta vaga]